jgi:hypothetical protein
MKTFVKFSRVALILWGVLILPNKARAQNVESPDPTMYSVSQEDFRAILSLLKLEMFKFNVDFPEDMKCEAYLYLEEYENRDLIKEKIIWGTRSPYTVFDKNGNPSEQPLDFVKMFVKNNTTSFSLVIRMGEFGIDGYELKIDSIYKNLHACKPFKLPEEYKIGDELPLLLIGSYWNATSIDGTMKAQKFCMENELLGDFSNQAFDLMPHYYVFGISIKEPRKEENNLSNSNY